ncbi:MAG: glycosyltransferase [Candidatus Omnitrophica bacterium]|nr:glycosyltransferase [Candidatus Omnitrophota bacterium]
MVKISVIIPTYNRANYICNAIDSVLAQTYKDFEIIVVDDGSTDNTKEILRQYDDKIRYFYQDNRGVSVSRNKGMREANGEYVAFLDSDDIWMPNKLERQISYMDSNPDIGLTYSFARYYSKDENYEKIRPKSIAITIKDMIETDAVLPTSTVMLRKKCLDCVGFFDESMFGMEDFDFWFRVAERFPINFISDIMVHVRSFDVNLSNQNEKMWSGYIAVYNKLIQKYKNVYDLRYMIRRLANRHYLLGAYLYKNGDFENSRENIKKAVQLYPLVGIGVSKQKDAFSRKLLLIFKPYLAFLYVTLKAELI